jgi:prevent-host-death family protein
MEVPMKHWPVQDAKARFSELLDTCLKEGPQIVTKRGAEAAVLVPAKEWERLTHLRRQTLKELLLAEAPRAAIPLPPRGGSRRRAVSKMS